jgi:DNA-binding GntR family transcriptional regulator
MFTLDIAWTVAAKLSPRSLRKLPLSSAIESGLGIRITDVKHLVGAKLVDAVLSARWQIPVGSPGLLVERNYFCKKICYCAPWLYRTDLFRYELKLKRGSAKPI